MEDLDVSEDPPIEHERTTIRVRVSGPSAVVDAALDCIYDLARDTLGIIDFRMTVQRNKTSIAKLKLVADRAGAIIECLDNMRTRLREFEHLDAAMATPDHTRAFYGFERTIWVDNTGRLKAGA